MCRWFVWSQAAGVFGKQWAHGVAIGLTNVRQRELMDNKHFWQSIMTLSTL